MKVSWRSREHALIRPYRTGIRGTTGQGPSNMHLNPQDLVCDTSYPPRQQPSNTTSDDIVKLPPQASATTREAHGRLVSLPTIYEKGLVTGLKDDLDLHIAGSGFGRRLLFNVRTRGVVIRATVHHCPSVNPLAPAQFPEMGFRITRHPVAHIRWNGIAVILEGYVKGYFISWYKIQENLDIPDLQDGRLDRAFLIIIQHVLDHGGDDHVALAERTPSVKYGERPVLVS
ncbi:hypothetical protein BDZ89DRAFT_1052332 [Hymenopellis radicata]|nr:hypothetical protein BDZ89DRAFT_1052332 [Hymenopellis radicata]